MSKLKLDEAIQVLRRDPRYSEVVQNTYLDADVQAAARRFYHSAEFAEVQKLLGAKIANSRILDLGAGAGIASYAFVQAGARRIYALEPDLSHEVGCGALKRLRGQLPIEIISAIGEDIPLRSASVDMVYTRQVLHHTHHLPRVLSECARILRSGGVWLACREHVVDNAQQLQIFLDSHPIHQLAGGENAYRLDEYLSAVTASGLRLEQVIGPWDSVINAFPGVSTPQELKQFARTLLRQKLGTVGLWMSFVPGAQTLVWKRVKRPVPGRMYSFLAVKP